jgi:hypothetical protein
MNPMCERRHLAGKRRGSCRERIILNTWRFDGLLGLKIVMHIPKPAVVFFHLAVIVKPETRQTFRLPH